MAKQPKKKVAAKRRNTRKPQVLESITGTDALAILKVLAERHENLAQEIDAVAKELLSHVEIDDVAAHVQMELEFLDVEDVWARSGATRDGYVDPGEAAWEMFAEALKPVQDEVEKYEHLSMLEDAALAYKEWATDAPGEYFSMILDDWKKLFAGQPPLSDMREFLQTHCPDWAEWATQSLRSRRP
jgi:hypothetical protein